MKVDNDRQGLVKLLPGEINGWVRHDSVETFDRESIFKYINGAGEVYNSYAFSNVLVAHYRRAAGSEVTVELFDMGNDNDAYGVFSYAREHEATGIGGGYELRGSVLCFRQDRYYVCLATDESVDDMEATLLSLARAISRQLPASTDRPDLIGMLPSERLVPFSDRFFHLHSALNYNYYLARENILSLGPETDAVLARYQPGSTYLLIVKYPSETDATRALASFRAGYVPDSGDSEAVMTESGKFVSSQSHGNYVVVVLDAPTQESSLGLRDSTVSRITTK